MFKVSDLKENQSRIVRETTAPFTYVEQGVEQTEQIRVRYFAFSIKRSRELLAEIEARGRKGNEVLITDGLAEVIESLPDFVDGKNKPVKITKEFLNEISSPNLIAIQDAIAKDLSPKSQPAR